MCGMADNIGGVDYCGYFDYGCLKCEEMRCPEDRDDQDSEEDFDQDKE